MRLKGLEPPRRRHQILSLARLPIPPQPHIKLYITAKAIIAKKSLVEAAAPRETALKHSRPARCTLAKLLVSAPSQVRLFTHRVRSPFEATNSATTAY